MRYNFHEAWHRLHRHGHDHDHHEHGERHHMRHGRHRGFGRFGGWGDGDAGFGFGRGRKLGADDLQLVTLALLAEKPRHGYELIKELDERSGGFYSPSPGMVYPALTYLEEIGYATVTAEGTKKLYTITEAGKAHLADNRKDAEAMLGQLDRIKAKMERVRSAFSFDFGVEIGGDDESARMEGELRQVRKSLKAILREAADDTAVEQNRIAAILRKAIDEIASGK